MPDDFLLYGANGFVGEAIARLAVQKGLKPILAGRNRDQINALAGELGLDCRVFSLKDTTALDAALGEVPVVLHAAGPYIYTAKPMVDACLRAGVHYVDITGEIPVLEAMADRNADAIFCNIMLLPGAGFDVVPTDCLALYLKQRLPSAIQLDLAWSGEGLKLPPGTANTTIELARHMHGFQIRRNGELEWVPPGESRMVDFGQGPVKVMLWNWADVFTSFYSTGIPNISDYARLPEQMVQQLRTLMTVRPLLAFAPFRNLVRSQIPSGSTPEERARARTYVWGEVRDEQGNKAIARMYGPEAGVEWTIRTALAVVQKVLAGNHPAGFQTPAKAYGPDFVMETEGITREDVK